MNIKKLATLFVFVFSTLLGTTYAEEVPQEIQDIIPALKEWGTNPILVAAVKAQNSEGMSLDEIKEKDIAWINNSGVDDFMQELMNNTAAQELKKMESSRPYFIELFLMDNQGANVAMTNKTSDYWQGDEAKFTGAFNNGAGGIDIGNVEFDSSSQAYLVQVSVPIMDEGKAIGALTIGINLDELQM